VFVALGIQLAKRMRRIDISVLSDCTVFAPTSSHKRHDFRKKKLIEHKMYVLIFSTTFVCNILLRRTERDIKNVHWSSWHLYILCIRKIVGLHPEAGYSDRLFIAFLSLFLQSYVEVVPHIDGVEEGVARLGCKNWKVVALNREGRRKLKGGRGPSWAVAPLEREIEKERERDSCWATSSLFCMFCNLLLTSYFIRYYTVGDDDP
jgi:hypothetical protein